MTHTCHARGCPTAVRPTLLMCARHWRLVPNAIQQEVYATYRRGQCDDRRPSLAWHEAASAAIGYVALEEKQGLTKNEVRALARRGYEAKIVEAYVAKMGENRRAAIMRTLSELQGNL